MFFSIFLTFLLFKTQENESEFYEPKKVIVQLTDPEKTIAQILDPKKQPEPPYPKYIRVPLGLKQATCTRHA